MPRGGQNSAIRTSCVIRSGRLNQTTLLALFYIEERQTGPVREQLLAAQSLRHDPKLATVSSYQPAPKVRKNPLDENETTLIENRPITSALDHINANSYSGIRRQPE
jgi:hypothetical protein